MVSQENLSESTLYNMDHVRGAKQATSNEVGSMKADHF